MPGNRGSRLVLLLAVFRTASPLPTALHAAPSCPLRRFEKAVCAAGPGSLLSSHTAGSDACCTACAATKGCACSTFNVTNHNCALYSTAAVRTSANYDLAFSSAPAPTPTPPGPPPPPSPTPPAPPAPPPPPSPTPPAPPAPPPSPTPVPVPPTPSPDAPQFLLYRSLWLLKVGQAADPCAPDVEGGPVERYSVQPQLPSGLSLDPASGVLAGTPRVAARSTTYTIVAINAHGSSNFTVNIVVFPPSGEAADLVVHLLPSAPGAGWATDRAGSTIEGLGTAEVPIDFALQRALERAEAGGVVRVGPGVLAPFSVNYKTLGHQLKDVHFLNSTAQHPIILLGDDSGGTIVTSPVNGTGGGALFSSAQVGAGNLHFVNFRFLQNWIGIELGSDTLAANNDTADAAEGFWFVNCEIDGRFNYCKTPATSNTSASPPVF